MPVHAYGQPGGRLLSQTPRAGALQAPYSARTASQRRQPVSSVHRPAHESARRPRPALATPPGHDLGAIRISPPAEAASTSSPPPVQAPIQLARTKASIRKKVARKPVPGKVPVERPHQRIKIHAFNLGHASGSRRTAFKIDLLKQHLERHRPDLLALSEVNDVRALRRKLGGKKSDYRLVEPPELSVGSTVYNPKTSTQYESYPLLVRNESSLQASYVGLAPKETTSEEPEQVKRDERGSSSVAWKHSRPLPLFAVTHPEGGSFLLGPVHTSPGTTVGEQTASYGHQLQGVLDAFPEASPDEPVETPPALLAGDFYNPTSAKGKEKVKALKDEGWEISRPQLLTNYHRDQKDQEKKAADFFIGTQGLIDRTTTRAVYPAWKGARKFKNPAEAWAKYPEDQLPGAKRRRRGVKVPTVTASDHSPAETELLLRNAHRQHRLFVQQSQRAIEVARRRAIERVQERRERLGLRARRKPVRRLIDEVRSRPTRRRGKTVTKR